MRIREEIDLFEILLAQPGEKLFVGAGRGDRGPEDPDDRGALGAAETGVPPGDHVGHDPALPVRRPGERDQGPFAGDEILDFDRVADGEDIRVARAHLFVDADPAALADLEPGHLRQRGLRTHADGEDHDVRRMRLAGFRENLERAARRLLEAGHRVT